MVLVSRQVSYVGDMVVLATSTIFHLYGRLLRVAAVSAAALAVLGGFVLTRERQGRVRIGAANLKVTPDWEGRMCDVRIGRGRDLSLMWWWC